MYSKESICMCTCVRTYNIVTVVYIFIYMTGCVTREENYFYPQHICMCVCIMYHVSCMYTLGELMFTVHAAFTRVSVL